MTTQKIESKCLEFYFNADGIYETSTSKVYMCILINTLEYSNGKQYYDISYVYNFYPDSNFSKAQLIEQYKNMNPLKKPATDCGGIVYKNRVITPMIEYLCMDDETLINETGSTTPQRYRFNIIQTLEKFWD